MKSLFQTVVAGAVLSAAALASSPADAARVVIGVGVGVPVYPYGYGYGYGYPGYWGPRYVAPEVIVQRPVVQVPAPAAASPDPIFYPKNGQPVAQIETDRQECNRWATSQPAAMADASVFQRATYACMEGRGYSVR